MSGWRTRFQAVAGVVVWSGLLLSGGRALAAELQRVNVDTGWEFRQHLAGPASQNAPWRPAQVPGDVHLDLLRNKLIPDPFYRDNEAKLQWIEDADWEYRTTLTVGPELLNKQNIDLVFEGLDTCADVYLNGKKILTTDNMFRTYRVDVKRNLTAGQNHLLVVFPSPIQAAAKIAAKDKWRALTHTERRSYIRKAAYEYGWDWGPRFVTSGIWRPVRLEGWDEARISDFSVRQLDVTAQVAHTLASVEVTASADTPAEVTVSESQAGQPSVYTQHVVLHPGVNHVDFPVDIVAPALWYPAGYGAQAMYSFHAEVKTSRSMQDAADVRTGLRSVVLRRDPDQWGRSFEFVVNGIPIFAKGADVIPFDSFPNRVTDEQYRHILQSARDANMNMIRLWGGGYYESQQFYQLCDELGLMVWQDFMFGNHWQPGTYAFKQNVAMEAEDQLKRLRNHPSIVLWCGNNETEAAFHWADESKASPSTRLQMWQDYLTVFSGILPHAVALYSPETPYWPSSPSADYEETSSTYQSGDMHDWSVWHGRVPFSEYEKHEYRFVSEYGFQSFPEMRTIESFTLPQDRTSIFTPVMLAHQKNNEGNSIIHDYMLQYYAEPKDFASFLYASQVLQAEGIKIGAEHMRRDRPRIMGSLFWQLNDCWPVASWSSIDYYGRWKALQYYARRFYSPLLVSPHIQNGALAVYVVSDKTKPVTAALRVRILQFDGTVLQEKTANIQIPPLSSQIYMQLPMEQFVNANGVDASKIFAATDLTVDGKSASSNLIYFVPTKQVHLPPAKIEATLSGDANDYQLRLSSPVLARSVYVSFGDVDADLSDNYFDLLPGSPTSLHIKSKASLEQLRQNMKIISLADAFGSNAASAETAHP